MLISAEVKTLNERFAQQGTPFVDALIAQTGGELEEAGVGASAGVGADEIVDRQRGGLVSDERIVAFAEVAAPGDVAARAHEDSGS